jgi:hypothetical protein
VTIMHSDGASVDLVGPRPTNAAVDVDERPARRALRSQIARLERELGDQRCSSWPRAMSEQAASRVARPRATAEGSEQRMLRAVATDRRSGPRMLSFGELEALRDELVSALATERSVLSERLLAEERSRRLREELLLDPASHAGARVRNAEVGEAGCGEVRSEPAAGLLGLLMGWWRVVVSSGCP